MLHCKLNFILTIAPTACDDDNVRAQARLLDSLGLEQLALIYGYSMGAMQALHFGCLYPSRVQRIAAVCGSARCFEGNKEFLESLRAAASADPVASLMILSVSIFESSLL